MKFLAVTLALLSAGSVSANASSWERDLQICPVASPNTPCTLEEAPVKCGSLNCEYPNQCNANAAGFTPGLCWPATCTTPSADVVCTMDSNPVLCGDSACEYANYCNAEAAGFPPTVCAAVNCPTPVGGAPCPANFDPHVCLVEGTGLCRYDNTCLASESGINVDAGLCMRTEEYVNNVLGDCPAVAADVACPKNYEPMNCGGCFYVSQDIVLEDYEFCNDYFTFLDAHKTACYGY